MTDATRRTFLATAGAGAMAGVAALALPRSASAAETVTMPEDAEGSMAAYVHDLAKGEVTLMVEGHEVVVTDKQLAARLARAFARAFARAGGH